MEFYSKLELRFRTSGTNESTKINNKKQNKTCSTATTVVGITAICKRTCHDQSLNIWMMQMMKKINIVSYSECSSSLDSLDGDSKSRQDIFCNIYSLRTRYSISISCFLPFGRISVFSCPHFVWKPLAYSSIWVKVTYGWAVFTNQVYLVSDDFSNLTWHDSYVKTFFQPWHS
jgi:hypothetical protein